MPTGRRHPLFLRLQKPIDPIYPDAVTPVAWDDDEPLAEAEGVVYLVTRPCKQLRTWAAQLRKLHWADQSYKTDEDISRLSAKPIRRESLSEIGRWTQEFFDEDFGTLRGGRRAHCVGVDCRQMVVVLDRVDGNAVGFVAFDIRWTVEALRDSRGICDLDIEYDQAWMAPEYRRRRWGESAAIGIAFAVRRHVDQIEQTARWPRDFTAKVRLTVGADIYSTSGERFLDCCAQYMTFQMDFPNGRRIEVGEIDVESRI